MLQVCPKPTALWTVTQMNPNAQTAYQVTKQTMPTINHAKKVYHQRKVPIPRHSQEYYTSISIMANINSITVLQLNPNGLSDAKQLLINKHL